MIVDDSFFIRNLLRSILELDGYRVVVEVTDGVQAVAKCREHRPSVTIMDVGLPRQAGIEAARAVALTGDTQVILCSTLPGKELAKAVRSAGAQGFIEKPFTLEQVREVVGRLVY